MARETSGQLRKNTHFYSLGRVGWKAVFELNYKGYQGIKFVKNKHRSPRVVEFRT